MPAHPFDAYLATQPLPQRGTLEAVAAALRVIMPTARCGPVDTPLPAKRLRALVAARVDAEMAHGPRAGVTRHFYANDVLKAKGGVHNGELHGKWELASPARTRLLRRDVMRSLQMRASGRGIG